MTDVEWANLKAHELRALAEKNAIVIVPVGSTEQHGPHMPVQTDARLSSEVAQRTARQIADRAPVVVTPAVWTGLAEHHMSLGGTITLDFEAFSRLLRGIVGSLTRQGFRRILLLNGHGGNIAALDLIVGDLTRELAIPLTSVNYWMVAPDIVAKVLERQTTLHHACEGETSLMLAVAPELVDTDRLGEAHGKQDGDPKMALGPGMGRWFSFAERTDTGVMGDAALASAEKGRVMLEAMVERLTEKLIRPDFWTAPA